MFYSTVTKRPSRKSKGLGVVCALGAGGRRHMEFEQLEARCLLAADVDIQVSVNGDDADVAPGPRVDASGLSLVVFNYQVTNTGTVPLQTVVVTDDAGTPGAPADDFNPPPLMNGNFNAGDGNTNNLLDVGETWLYFLGNVVSPGQHTNIAEVTAEQVGTLTPVMDQDPTNHFGVLARLDIEKFTNGENADTAPGVPVEVGSDVNLTFEVTNIGNMPLVNLVVMDDNGTPGNASDDFEPAPVLNGAFNVGDTLQDGIFGVGEKWEFAHDLVAAEGQHTNTASATADEPILGLEASDSDVSNHFGGSAEIEIEKTTNGVDADGGPGPSILVGEVADFLYTVTNTGTIDLVNVEVSDDNGTPGDDSDDLVVLPVLVGGFNTGDGNKNDILDDGEAWQFFASRVVTPGPHLNLATATAQDPQTLDVIATEDPSNHFGAAPAIDVQKETNGEDADTGTGPIVLVGDTVSFAYRVSNPGNVPLGTISLSDDNGTPADAGDDFAPTPVVAGNFNIGDTDQDGLLDTDEVWRYTTTRDATTGQHTNMVTASGDDSGTSTTVSATDASNHFGAAPAIVIEKATNGDDADTPTGPVLAFDSIAEFTYEVTNTGNVPLANVMVNDDNGTPAAAGDDFEPVGVTVGGVNVGDDNGDGLLDADETWEYTATRAVTSGQHANTAIVTADHVATAKSVDDDDLSHHFGDDSLFLVTNTNDEGSGSLRQALLNAAASPSGGEIVFQIPDTDPGFVDIDAGTAGGDAAPDVFVIRPKSALPAIDNVGGGVLLDGATQIATTGDTNPAGPAIVIDGVMAGLADGLELLSDGNTVANLNVQGFQRSGLRIAGDGNTVSGNFIGTDATGATAAANGEDGVSIPTGSGNTIGESAFGAGNVIGFNGGNGVTVVSGTGNRIDPNSFFDNAGLAIDLGGDGLTFNDAAAGSEDSDTGANRLQNYPVLQRVEVVGDKIEIDYLVPSAVGNATYPLHIDFLLTDDSGYEGRTFIGDDTYTAADFASGLKKISFALHPNTTTVGRIVAIATDDDGNTSEFSGPKGVLHPGLSDAEKQQIAASEAAGAIQEYLEQLLTGDPGDVPPPDAGAIGVVIDDPVIDDVLIGANVAAADASDAAIAFGFLDNPLVFVGFNEPVDGITDAVNQLSIDQILQLIDILTLAPGQTIVSIWFDPVNFAVSNGTDVVRYDFDNNPNNIVGSLPGAALVVTPAGPSTPGGVQGILIVDNRANLQVQLNNTVGVTQFRGGINFYTVAAAGGGLVLQPTMRTAFQGQLPRDSIVMSFDPSQPDVFPVAALNNAVGTTNAVTAVSDTSGLPLVTTQQLFLSFAESSDFGFQLDIGGGGGEADMEEEAEGDPEEDAQGQNQEEDGDDKDPADKDMADEDGMEDNGELDGDADPDEQDKEGDDEQRLEDAVSVIFRAIGEALESRSGRLDVLTLLRGEQESANEDEVEDEDSETSDADGATAIFPPDARPWLDDPPQPIPIAETEASRR